MVLVLGALITIGLVIGTQTSINDSDDRALSTQLNSVVTAVQQAPSSLQLLLEADCRWALGHTIGSFKQFAFTTGVGPLRSISLWQERPGRAPRLVTVVGRAPQLLHDPTGAAFLRSVHPSSTMFVVPHVVGVHRSLGLAVMLPRGAGGYFVYAENPNTAPSPLFAGLQFALYLGTSTAPSELIETSMRLPPTGRTASKVLSFGSARVTVLSTLVGRPSGVLPSGLPLTLGIAGGVLTLLAADVVERLVRRREASDLVATDRTRDYDAQRDIAETLQHALLPAKNPTFPGLEIATRYVAGVEHLDVGGDWYDAIAQPDGRLFITIGDVSGRGLVAATMMATLRHSIRAYAMQGDAPEEVLRKLDDLVDVSRDDCFATVCCAVLDVGAHEVNVASAGHPPPLLLDRDGSRFLVPPVKPPIGVPSPTRPRALSLTVGPGATFVLYTDGLVERRNESLDVGLEQLRMAAGTTGDTVEHSVTAILDALTPEGPDDDVAILAVRWLA